MNTEEFWKIIDTSYKNAESIDDTVRALSVELENLAREELQSFQNHYESFIKNAYRWDLWGAAFVMNGGCSDDGFRYFLDWLISEGSITYQKALENPDNLSEVPKSEYAENESFAYVALEVYEKKGYGELDRDFSIELSMPMGDEWEEDDLSSLFPRLTKIYES